MRIHPKRTEMQKTLRDIATKWDTIITNGNNGNGIRTMNGSENTLAVEVDIQRI